MENFRTDTSHIDKTLFFNKTTTLIVIGKTNKCYYQTKSEKETGLSLVNWSKDTVLFVWPGQWKTDVFRFSKEEYDTLMKKAY